MEVGDVSGKEKTDYSWKIPDFFLRTEDETVDFVYSPTFMFSGFSCSFTLSTRGLRNGKAMLLGLNMLDAPADAKKVCCTIGVERSDGTLESAKTLTLIFKSSNCTFAIRPNAFNLSVLRRRSSELVPSGTLTIACSMKAEDDDQRCARRMSQSLQTSEIDASSPDDVLAQSAKFAGTFGLARDLKALLLSGNNSDATIRVEGQEFRVHRNILAARTPVFSAMFNHDTKENASGILDIKDSDPDTIQRFLQFIYTGRIDDLTADNATGVYEMADKYQVLELKEECLGCIKRGLSVETFCHIITLALKHDEKELTALATDFFVQNSKKIVRTVEWQAFLSENPVQANELVIKGLGDE